MEATESLVAALLQAKGYIVSTNYKIRPDGFKTYGGQSGAIDIDILAFESRERKVLVGEVKSYWGSRGVVPEHVVDRWTDERGHHHGLKLINNKDGIQQTMWKLLKRQIGADYHFHCTLFAGRITDKAEVERRLAKKRVFGNPVSLVVIEDLLREFVSEIRSQNRRSYVNDPAIAAIFALEEYGMLTIPQQAQV